MNPRDEARRAANLVPVDITPNDTCRLADAASDVWEPIVERLKGALAAAGVNPRLVEAIAYDTEDADPASITVNRADLAKALEYVCSDVIPSRSEKDCFDRLKEQLRADR